MQGRQKWRRERCRVHHCTIQRGIRPSTLCQYGCSGTTVRGWPRWARQFRECQQVLELAMALAHRPHLKLLRKHLHLPVSISWCTRTLMEWIWQVWSCLSRSPSGTDFWTSPTRSSNGHSVPAWSRPGWPQWSLRRRSSWPLVQSFMWCYCRRIFQKRRLPAMLRSLYQLLVRKTSPFYT